MSPATTKQVARILRRSLPALLFAPAVFLTGCATNTGTGALAGGGLGALTGALVGGAVGRPGAGAAIGAGLGGATGALIGNDMDAKEKREERLAAQAAAARAPGGPLTTIQVGSLVRQGVSDDVIITQIRTTGSVFNLGSTDIQWLKENGVSDRVIQEMQWTAARPRRVYTAVPVYEPPPVVVVEEPAPVVGVGIGFHRRW
jgi:hypothetical protein